MSAEKEFRWRLILHLAAKDWWHDRRMSLLILASLTAVIAPLLLLFALRNGIVAQLLDELSQDPSTLEVRIRGNWQLEQGWLDELRRQPFVQFAVPMTRTLNLSMDLQKDSRTFVRGVELIPTAAGDPLLTEGLSPPANWQQILITRALAEKLTVVPGDMLHGRVLRIYRQQNQVRKLNLRVTGIVDTSAAPRHAALVSLSLLNQLEAYKDGLDIAAWNEHQHEAYQESDSNKSESSGSAGRQYAKARIYASSLAQVGALVAYLEAQNLPVRSRLQAIAQAQSVISALTIIYLVVAATAVLGCIASLVGSFVAGVERKRRQLAMLRLMGFGGLVINGYLMLQALLTAFLAYLCGVVFCQLACVYLNRVLAFAASSEPLVCRISILEILCGLMLTLLIAGSSALTASVRASRIQPAELLRGQ